MKRKIAYYQLNKEELESLQKKCVEILSFVIKAINQMGLTYYCIGGTAIGAYKYKGFVPWDDDIDIAMPRQDFMTFIKDGAKFLPQNLVISSCFNEKHNFFGVTKVRDSQTTFYDIETARFNVNHGVFIDIFPIDGYCSEPTHLQKFKYRVFSGRIGYKQNNNKTLSQTIKGFVCSVLCLFCSPNKCRLKLEKMLMKKTIDESPCVFNRLMVFDKNIFGVPRFFKFHDLDVCLPEKTDEYLKICFGDITKDVEEEKKKQHHFAYMIDMNTPFAHYEFKKGAVRRIK